MKRWVVLLLLVAALATGIGVPLMDNDAAHHAAIALRMTETGDYVTLQDVTYDIPYFDKPHLQFWLVGGSFAWLGVGGVVYKLSSLLFVLLTLVSLYKLGERLVPRKNVGATAVVVLLSMVAFMLGSSVDIRMDAILTGSVALAVWQGVVCIGGRKDENYGGSRRKKDSFSIMPYLGLGLGLALALAVKGMYGVALVGGVLFFYALGVRRMRWIFSWRFLVVLGLFLVMILPVLWAYYIQFGWEGVHFILYEQVLIRTGGGMGDSGASDPLFFAHTLLWVVLPWSFVLLTFMVRAVTKRQFDPVFWLTVPGSVAMMVLLSFSSFKLPHYLNPLFPLFALFVADRLVSMVPRMGLMRGVGVAQKVVLGLFVAVAGLVNYWIFPFETVWVGALYGVVLLVLVVAMFTPWDRVERIVGWSAVGSAVLWLGLNGNFYPQLLRLQSGNELAAVCKDQGIAPKDVAVYRWNDYSTSFDIHHGGLHRMVWASELVDTARTIDERYLMINRRSADSLRLDSLFSARWRTIRALPDYRITQLTGRFLNPSTRAAELDTTYFMEQIGR